MRRKRIYAAALAGAMVLGTALSSGTSAQAAAEDWFRFDVNEQGEQQPSVAIMVVGDNLQYWGVSYGHTLHSDYKYILRLPYDGTGYKDDGEDDGYGYYDAYYIDMRGKVADQYAAQAERNAMKAEIYAGGPPWSNEFLGEVLETFPDVSVPADKEMWIRTLDRVENGTPDAAIQALASGYMLVYDQSNNLVDSFPLMGAPADNTVPAQAQEIPTETTPVPDAAVSVPTDTVPTVSETVPTAAVTSTNTGSNVLSDSGSVETVAREVLKGKWGVGKERRIRLEAAGYNYSEVQNKVREIMK